MTHGRQNLPRLLSQPSPHVRRVPRQRRSPERRTCKPNIIPVERLASREVRTKVEIPWCAASSHGDNGRKSNGQPPVPGVPCNSSAVTPGRCHRTSGRVKNARENVKWLAWPSWKNSPDPYLALQEYLVSRCQGLPTSKTRRRSLKSVCDLDYLSGSTTSRRPFGNCPCSRWTAQRRGSANKSVELC